jgi:hypothetical protein
VALAPDADGGAAWVIGAYGCCIDGYGHCFEMGGGEMAMRDRVKGCRSTKGGRITLRNGIGQLAHGGRKGSVAFRDGRNMIMMI